MNPEKQSDDYYPDGECQNPDVYPQKKAGRNYL